MKINNQSVISFIAILAATATVQATPAPVLAQGRALISSMQYEVYDLNPGDSIAPSAEFIDPVNGWRTSNGVYIYEASSGNDVVNDAGIIYTTPTTASQFPAITRLHSAVQVDPDFGGAGGAFATTSGFLVAQGQVWRQNRGYNSLVGFSTTATAEFSPTFYNLVLGPGTGVRISAQGTVQSWLRSDGSFAASHAELFARFSPRAADGRYQGALSRSYGDAVNSIIDATDPAVLAGNGALIFREDTRLLKLDYQNTTSAQVVGRVRFLVQSTGEALAVSNVPEPATALTLLAGLVLIVFVRRTSVKPTAL